MSMLDRAPHEILIFHAVDFEDELGNVLSRPSAVGVPARAQIQAAKQSGTSARRAEQDNEGYETEETYRMRFTRSYDRTHPPLMPGTQVEWQGKRWSIVGYPTQYMGSRRTSHIDYMLKRS